MSTNDAPEATLTPARYGEVIYERPSPDELDEAGRRVAIIRDNISVLRSEVENLERAWAPLPGDNRRFRDVEGLLTAALVLLHESEVQFPKQAKTKREKLAHPETYVVKEGFYDERREAGMVEVWWWDRYSQDFGPSLSPMPWRERRNTSGQSGAELDLADVPLRPQESNSETPDPPPVDF